jgi:hypothetical protein
VGKKRKGILDKRRRGGEERENNLREDKRVKL